MQPGVLVMSHRGPAPEPREVVDRLGSVGLTGVRVRSGAGLLVAVWGGLSESAGVPVRLSSGARSHEHDVTDADLVDLLTRRDTAAAARVLPPFAALLCTEDEAVAAVDALGMRHLYTHRGAGSAALSTSARALAALAGLPLDVDAVGLQSLLGWQVGDGTWHRGVTKVGAGQIVVLRNGQLLTYGGRAPRPARVGLDEAVEEAASVLRGHLAAYVGQHPDCLLQLTGGQDSRILLSAVPRDLRPGVRAMTLGVPGNPDVAIAGDIARRESMSHQVEDVPDLLDLDPAAAAALVAGASRDLEAMADPVATAVLVLAERRFDQGHRIAGLGGEVARGFYYVGPVRPVRVTRARVERLAGWRMFANEAVDPAALTPTLRASVRERALDRVEAALREGGPEWFTATDEFYLYERMQRWAGVGDTAAVMSRSIVNPMLDDRFVALARALDPRSKQGSLFLARLQMALDPGLGSLPLDGRPPPAAYARRGPAARTAAARSLAHRALAKARQRASGTRRPPAGGAVLAARVVEHWRACPHDLAPAAAHGVLDTGWLEQLAAGRVEATPATVALVANLAALPALAGRTT